MMKTQPLGTSDLHITPIGLGTWAIGGSGWLFGWGSQDDRESLEAIERAVDLGINWIDTAPVYGLGHSEEIVGQAIKNCSTKPYIFTKCTRRWQDNGMTIYGDLTADSLRREVEDSLRRLDIDVIDLYQVHWPDPDEYLEEAWTTLAQLKEEGKVRYIGVSNFNVEQMERVQKVAPITSLQPPYSMLNRGIEKDILGHCERHNIGVLAYSPMMNGLLTGKMTRERIHNLPEDDWRRGHPAFQEPQLTRNLQLVELLRDIGNEHDRTPAEVAVAWTFHHPAVTAAIVGARRASQVEGIIGAGTFRLDNDALRKIDQFLEQNPVPEGEE